MSTARQTIFSKSPDVLVRAFRGEPVKLRAKGSLGEAIEVFGSREETSIGLRASAVYQFDETLFTLLRSAYESGDKDRLESLWREARGFLNTVETS